MKQRVRTPQFLNRVIKVYDFTTLFSRLMMYRRAKSSLVQPKKEGEEETMYNMYNSMFIRIKKKNKFNDKKMARILKRFYNISPTSTVDVMHTCKPDRIMLLRRPDRYRASRIREPISNC